MDGCEFNPELGSKSAQEVKERHGIRAPGDSDSNSISRANHMVCAQDFRQAIRKVFQ
jgi:hypothetical protein